MPPTTTTTTPQQGFDEAQRKARARLAKKQARRQPAKGPRQPNALKLVVDTFKSKTYDK